MTPEGWVRIGNFGICKRVINGDTALTKVAGTTGYLAPEVLGFIEIRSDRRGYTNAVDMWSLGAVVHWMMTSKVKFPTPRSFFLYSTGASQFPYTARILSCR